MWVNKRILFGMAAAFLTRPVFGASISKDDDYSEANTSVSALKTQLYNEVNTARRRRGRSKLKRSKTLEKAALKFAKELDRKKYGVGRGRVAFKAHGKNKESEVKRRARAAGYKVRIIGENVGYYQHPSRVVPGWSNSPEHSFIMFYPKMTEMGLGISGKVYVLMMGKPKR